MCKNPYNADLRNHPEILERFRKHLLDRDYMSGVERDQLRIKQTAEVFTPDFMVQELVEKTGLDIICDPDKTILDPSCGDGQFLAYILYKRLEAGHSLCVSLSTLFGVELMPDNVEECRKRLSCGLKNEDITNKLKENIVEQDFLEYAAERKVPESMQNSFDFSPV